MMCLKVRVPVSSWHEILRLTCIIQLFLLREMFQQQAVGAVLVTAEAELPGRREWVEARCFIGILYWNLFECLDFLQLSPATQGKLPGSISPGVSRLAVRMRIFAILEVHYIQPQYKGAHIGHRGPYEVLQRQLMAQTCNLAQAKAGVLDPVVMKAGNGRTMNAFIRDVHDKVLSNLSFRQWKREFDKNTVRKKPNEGTFFFFFTPLYLVLLGDEG